MSWLHNYINLSTSTLSHYWKLPVKASITRSKHSITQIHKPTIQLTYIYVISLHIFLSHYNSSMSKTVHQRRWWWWWWVVTEKAKTATSNLNRLSDPTKRHDMLITVS